MSSTSSVMLCCAADFDTCFGETCLACFEHCGHETNNSRSHKQSADASLAQHATTLHNAGTMKKSSPWDLEILPAVEQFLSLHTRLISWSNNVLMFIDDFLARTNVAAVVENPLWRRAKKKERKRGRETGRKREKKREKERERERKREKERERERKREKERERERKRAHEKETERKGEKKRVTEKDRVLDVRSGSWKTRFLKRNVVRLARWQHPRHSRATTPNKELVFHARRTFQSVVADNGRGHRERDVFLAVIQRCLPQRTLPDCFPSLRPTPPDM